MRDAAARRRAAPLTRRHAFQLAVPPRSPEDAVSTTLEAPESFVVVVGIEARLENQAVTAGGQVVELDHLLDQVVERRPGRPAELCPRLARISEQAFDLGRTEVAGVDLDNHVADLALGGRTALQRRHAADDADFLGARAGEPDADAKLHR